jgi:type III secretion protein J
LGSCSLFESLRRWILAAAKSRGACLALLLGALTLAGCQQDLYSGLTEVEANQMLAVLIANNIGADKASKGKEGFTISVDTKDMLRAIAVLNDSGYPKNTRDSIGKVFQKSGIMSSPFEEHVRYIYALGEEVAQTLSAIDGVVTARVHIVLPDPPQLGQPVKPSSAAVFIKHRPDVDLDFFVPQIRRLVSSSIEGLKYDAVTVVLADAAPTKVETPVDLRGNVEVIPGLSVREADQQRFWWLMFGVGILITLLIAANAAMFYVFVWSRRGDRKTAVNTAVPMVEPS